MTSVLRAHDVEWDGEVLTLGVVLLPAEIDQVVFRPGWVLRKGSLTVVSGTRTFRVRFLSRYRREFADLARELGADVD